MILIRTGGLPLHVWQSLVSTLPLETPLEGSELYYAASVQDSFDKALITRSNDDFRTLLYNARKDFFQKRKMPKDSVWMAIESRKSEPAIGELLESLQMWQSSTQWVQHFEKKYQEGLLMEWKAIQKVASNELFRRTLLFASHDLLHQLPGFCAKPVQLFGKKERQTANAVLQYLKRSIFKTSPLGRFTTVQLWRLSQKQALDFDVEKIAVTPSVAILPALYEVLLLEPAFYESLDVLLNPCISSDYTKGLALSWLYFDGEQEAFQRMEANPVVEYVVTLMLENERKLSYTTLLAKLCNEVAAPSEHLAGLLKELIGFGLLAWELPEKGLSPSWCSNLCNYLSFLPSEPVLTEAAFLLQLLRVSARAMSFQTVEEAQKTQQEATESLKSFFLKFGDSAPPISAEQIFFEDVEKSVSNDCPEVAIQQFTQTLKERWIQNEAQPLPAFRSRLYHFTANNFAIGQVIDFQIYCSRFFSAPIINEPAFTPPFQGKVGVMLQVYKDQDNYRAVVNAMFPGGGKLYARWLHLFPSDFRESIESWSDPETILFPWQGWSNANFQNIERGGSLSVPDGRVGGGTKLLLSDLGVRRGDNGPELVDKRSLKRVLLTDLGLEAPESRPPVMQVLWHLGVPFVSSLALLPKESTWKTLGNGVKKRERQEYQSLVLAREAWDLDSDFFKEILLTPAKTATRYRQIIKELSQLGVPKYFYARLNEPRHKPQFFDQECLVSMLIFEKVLTSMNTSGLFIEEMLPMPHNWVLGAGEKYSGEFVVEFACGT